MRPKEDIVNKIVLLLVLSVFSVGCSYRAIYDIGLSEVERPLDANNRYGEQKIVSFEDKNEDETVTKHKFEDGMIEIVGVVTPDGFLFNLRNKTEHSIKIIWDESVYVDENGESKRIMHTGVKYSNKTQSQVPTTIVSGASVTDSIIPVDNVFYAGEQGWKKIKLLPEWRRWIEVGIKMEKVSDFQKRVSGLIGKNMRLLLALQIEGITNDYMFSFIINDVEVKKTQPKKPENHVLGIPLD